MEDTEDSISTNSYNRVLHYALPIATPAHESRVPQENLEHATWCGTLNRKLRMKGKVKLRIRKEMKVGETIYVVTYY